MSVTKVCVNCGQDCSNRARSKDTQGRYVCQPCIEAAKASASTARPPVQSPHPLADDLPIAVEPDDRTPKTKSCVNCGATVAKAALECSSCGFDFAAGKVVRAPKPSGRRCIKCAYDLTGVKSARCPECGTLNTDASRKALVSQRERTDNIRAEYTKPLYMLAGGLVVSTAVALLSGDSLVPTLITFSLHFAISAVIGTVAFFLACLIWIGFDAPFHLTALRLLGIAAVCEAVWQITVRIPIPFVASGALLITYIGLLQSMLGLDLHDAIVFSIINWMVKLFVVISIISAIGTL